MTSSIQRFFIPISASLFVVTLALYWPVLEQDFVYFDDHRYVTENSAIQQGIDWTTFEWAFTTDRMGTWHPLTWLSHAADWKVYGSDAGGHHLTNLLLHTLNVLLLYGVLRRMTGSTWASAFVAFVFAVHPINVASVAWIASRKGVLSTTFWLLSMRAYEAYTRQGGRWRYFLVLAFFGLGLMSKPMLVSLPVIFLLLDVWPLRRIGWNGRAIGDSRPFLEKFPLALMAVAVSIVVVLVRHVGEPIAWTDRWARVPVAYFVYLKRILWPTGLATPYPPQVMPTASDMVVATIVLVGVTAVVIQSGRKRPYVTVGWLWFLVTLAPVIGLVQIGAHLMADRWTYVPMIGIAIMVAWSVPSLFPREHIARAVVGGAGVVAVVALLMLARTQIANWQNTETLFRHAIAVTNGNRTAHYNLAWFLAQKEQPDEAIAHYRSAIEIEPTHFPSHHNLALLLIERGRTGEAVEAICAAIRIADPSDERARHELTAHLDGAQCP